MAQEKYEIKIPKSGMASLYPKYDLDSVMASKRIINESFGTTDEKAETEVKAEEEWVWIEGYKGTDRHMFCRGYKFNLHEQFDMPEGEPIVECQSGFHLCPSLPNVFQFYGIEDGNRFFRVKALVRKWDADKLHELYRPGKLVAKSIIFLSELTTDEIFEDAYVNTKGWTDEDREAAREEGCTTIDRRVKTRTLIGLGYSESVAEYIVDRNRFLLAKMLGQQTDISMDTKFICLFNGL